MAFFGLFGNYDKPGPGVSKDEPKKAAPVRFFEILWRKLSKLIQLNLIYMIPFIVAVALMVGVFLLPLPHFAFNTVLLGPVDLYALYAVPLPLILMAPFSNGVIVYVAYVFLSFSIFFYSNQMSSNWLYIIPFAICAILLLLMLFAQYYIPLMIVTMDLKLRHIYRNAFIFAILGLPRNILITLILVAMVVGTLYCPGGFLAIPLILLILIVLSFVSYLCSFAAYPMLDKYLIQPYYRKEAEAAEKKTVAAEGETFSFEADELDDEDEDAPKYVYVNGRLIERSALKQEEAVFSDETKEHLN